MFMQKLNRRTLYMQTIYPQMKSEEIVYEKGKWAELAAQEK